MKKTNKDSYLEFLPAALEIEASPPPKFARSLLWVLIMLFVIAIVWACVSEIDIVATANGKLVPSGKVKVIQPISTSIVNKIHVKEGQRVAKGERLVSLDSSINEAELRKLNNELASVSNDMDLNSALIEFAEQGRHTIDESHDIYALLIDQLTGYRAESTSLDNEINLAKLDLKTSKTLADGIAKTLPIVQERAEGLQKLLNEGLVSREQFLEVSQIKLEHETRLASELAQVEKATASIQSFRQKKQAYKASFILENQEKLVVNQRKLHSLQQELSKIKSLQQQHELYSPVDGVVEKLAISTLGGVVTSAQEIMHIVPEKHELIVEAGLLNKDIGFVKAGDTAEVKLEAFPFMKYGVVSAKILNVSSDAVEHESLGLVFPIKAELGEHHLNINGSNVKLQPGMQASVEIKTGKRKVIEFLLAPILKGLDEGVRER